MLPVLTLITFPPSAHAVPLTLAVEEDVPTAEGHVFFDLDGASINGQGVVLFGGRTSDGFAKWTYDHGTVTKVLDGFEWDFGVGDPYTVSPITERAFPFSDTGCIAFDAAMWDPQTSTSVDAVFLRRANGDLELITTEDRLAPDGLPYNPWLRVTAIDNACNVLVSNRYLWLQATGELIAMVNDETPVPNEGSKRFDTWVFNALTPDGQAVMTGRWSRDSDPFLGSGCFGVEHGKGLSAIASVGTSVSGGGTIDGCGVNDDGVVALDGSVVFAAPWRETPESQPVSAWVQTSPTAQPKVIALDTETIGHSLDIGLDGGAAGVVTRSGNETAVRWNGTDLSTVASWGDAALLDGFTFYDFTHVLPAGPDRTYFQAYATDTTQNRLGIWVVDDDGLATVVVEDDVFVPDGETEPRLVDRTFSPLNRSAGIPGVVNQRGELLIHAVMGDADGALALLIAGQTAEPPLAGGLELDASFDPGETGDEVERGVRESLAVEIANTGASDMFSVAFDITLPTPMYIDGDAPPFSPGSQPLACTATDSADVPFAVQSIACSETDTIVDPFLLAPGQSQTLSIPMMPAVPGAALPLRLEGEAFLAGDVQATDEVEVQIDVVDRASDATVAICNDEPDKVEVWLTEQNPQVATTVAVLTVAVEAPLTITGITAPCTVVDAQNARCDRRPPLDLLDKVILDIVGRDSVSEVTVSVTGIGEEAEPSNNTLTLPFPQMDSCDPAGDLIDAAEAGCGNGGGCTTSPLGGWLAGLAGLGLLFARRRPGRRLDGEPSVRGRQTEASTVERLGKERSDRRRGLR